MSFRTANPEAAAQLAGRLKQLRTEVFACSPEEVAALAGVSVRAWYFYENNINAPGTQVLTALARAGVNVHWLLLGGGAPLQNGRSGRLGPPRPAPGNSGKEVCHG